MQILENFSLRPYNSFRIDVMARQFANFASIEELSELLSMDSRPPTLILGGGSNILFTQNYDGIVLKNGIKGIEILQEDDEFIYVKVGAGENWHGFVMHCIQNGWAGLENLSLIPGCVGASPMQNIGAYGVEIMEYFHELQAFHIEEKVNYHLGVKDCEFGYRDSVFKRKYKDKFVIATVTYRLNKHPKFNTSYGAINQELEKMGVNDISIRAISQAVINIRSSKLPDPAVIGNAGSFFKNPQIPLSTFRALKAKHENIPSFPVDDKTIKVPAAWLIEQCGWKGFRKGDAGCHDKQPLVLVNFGNAKGREIYELSEQILSSVNQKFGILLEREVNII